MRNLKLKHFVNISAGHPFRGKISEAPGFNVCVIQMKDISSDMDIHWQKTIRTKLVRKGEPNWLQPGDILFAARGDYNYAAVIDQPPYQISALAAPHFYVVRCLSDKILPGYLAWLLNQNPCQRYFQRESEGTLTKSIRRKVLEETPIVIPTLNKQNHIIQLDKMLRKERQLIKELAQNTQTLMNTIVRNLFENYSKEIYAND